jgi:hypothetical protein
MLDFMSISIFSIYCTIDWQRNPPAKYSTLKGDLGCFGRKFDEIGSILCRSAYSPYTIDWQRNPPAKYSTLKGEKSIKIEHISVRIE